MKSKKKITPEIAVAQLKTQGVAISATDAETLLDFLYLIAELFYQRQTKPE